MTVGNVITAACLGVVAVCAIVLADKLDSDASKDNSPPSAAAQASPHPDDYRILEQQGYTHIQLHGWKPFKCAEDDNPFYTDTFTAVAFNGQRVSGAVCGALLKAKTVRLD